MNEKKIISQLKQLKSVEPDNSWVVETRKSVLLETVGSSSFLAKYNNKKEHNLSGKSSFVPSFDIFSVKRLSYAMASVVFVLFSGFATVNASKSSLPGDALYNVKIASENVVLAIASEDKKAEIEIKQAGKRVEEIKEVSKRISDIDQGEKLKQLAINFEKKINNAQDGLIKIENSDKKAKIARVINIQTEKYTEGFIEASENLTDIVKSDVSEKLSSAADSNRKVNLDSLAVRIEVMTDDDKDEITAIVNGKVEKEAILDEKEAISDECETDLTSCSNDEEDLNFHSDGADVVDLSPRSNNNISEEDVITNYDNIEIDSDISDDTKDDTENNVEEDVTIEEEKEVLINLLDNLNSDFDDSDDEITTDDNSPDEDDGEVKGETDDNVKGIEAVEKVMPVS